MPVTVVVEFRARPEHRETFVAYMLENLPQTRAWPGCRDVECLVEHDDPAHLVVWQHWDERAQFDAYIAWRRESGASAAVAPWTLGPPTVHCHDSLRTWP